MIPKITLRIFFVDKDHKLLVQEKAMGLFYPYGKGAESIGEGICDILVDKNDDTNDTFYHEITHFLMFVSGKNVYSHGKKFKKILKLLVEELG